MVGVYMVCTALLVVWALLLTAMMVSVLLTGHTLRGLLRALTDKKEAQKNA